MVQTLVATPTLFSITLPELLHGENVDDDGDLDGDNDNNSFVSSDGVCFASAHTPSQDLLSSIFVYRGAPAY